MADTILFLNPNPRPHGKPWESFPGFARWSAEQTPQEDTDGLSGVRAGCAMAGIIGALQRAVLASLDEANDFEEVKGTIQGECSRLLMAATILADEIGFNPIRTLDGKIDSYLTKFNLAYGVHEHIPMEERGYFAMNLALVVGRHMLPVCYAIAIDKFTLDGIRRDDACEELLKGVHEMQTLLDVYDLKLSEALERHVRSVVTDPQCNPQGMTIDE